MKEVIADTLLDAGLSAAESAAKGAVLARESFLGVLVLEVD